MNFEQACRTVLAECKDGYAKAYAEAGLGMYGHEAKVQALYILSNISKWRGSKATEVRGWLKEFSKELR